MGTDLHKVYRGSFLVHMVADHTGEAGIRLAQGQVHSQESGEGLLCCALTSLVGKPAFLPCEELPGEVGRGDRLRPSLGSRLGDSWGLPLGRAALADVKRGRVRKCQELVHMVWGANRSEILRTGWQAVNSG